MQRATAFVIHLLCWMKVLRGMDAAQSRYFLPEKDLRLTAAYTRRLKMGEYSSSFSNVGKCGCACRAARIPDDGA
jgi:hypothetical protein